MAIKAEITPVRIGHLSIEGLMNENGEFGVAVPQLSDLKLVPPNRSAKQLQALVGNGFQSHLVKWKTPLNPKAVNVLPLESFQDLVRALDKKGNPAAAAFVDALFGLSIHQLFCDAFGQKFESEDRQQWLRTRGLTKADFRLVTDELKAQGFEQPEDYGRFVYAFQMKLGIKSGTRDKLSLDKLVLLQGAQVQLVTLMRCGYSPWDALSQMDYGEMRLR